MKQSIRKNIFLILFILISCYSCNKPHELDQKVFRISAIPDQDPDILQRLYGNLATYLQNELGVKVEYVPVIDYSAAVTAFRVGDLDMVWFGGLTGIQARQQLPSSQAIIQRDVDANFHSVFICNTNSKISPIKNISELQILKNHTFTFGSESSTSGRLMPQYFLEQAGIDVKTNFSGNVGYSGSHDLTLKLVESGSYDCGVLNEQVWKDRLQNNSFNKEQVVSIWVTPAYYDYHWVIRTDVNNKFGDGFIEKVENAFLTLDIGNPDEKKILELFGAQKFIYTTNDNYLQLTQIAKNIGLVK